MTGFGAGEAHLGGLRLSLELRSVNHRYLEVRVRLPRELADHGVFLEQRVRAQLSRGRVDVSGHLEGALASGHGFDEERARAVLASMQRMADALGYTERVPLGVLGAMPELFTGSGGHEPAAAREALEAALATAVARFEESRAAEGRHLRVALAALLSGVSEAVEAVSAQAAGMTARLRQRARQRVLGALGELSLDEARLTQELVLWSERSDVSEELTRLRAHADAMGSLLAQEGAVGRRMDFLLQEMAREANTLGAKATDAAVTTGVVALKADLERMREQAQNVE
ncbi:MAG: YicC/YloC family endoribonuclease [Deltaproteobacteria bacterium]|nr:YicC/YloC family endoribonuclease [Deltaproteobacteria bacterium]